MNSQADIRSTDRFKGPRLFHVALDIALADMKECTNTTASTRTVRGWRIATSDRCAMDQHAPGIDLDRAGAKYPGGVGGMRTRKQPARAGSYEDNSRGFRQQREHVRATLP
jgi:hypothetical protein